jgi:hypothetical protein
LKGWRINDINYIEIFIAALAFSVGVLGVISILYGSLFGESKGFNIHVVPLLILPFIVVSFWVALCFSLVNAEIVFSGF